MSSTPFGEHLRREREMRGVSLEEIQVATRIGLRYLEALENERWDQLPGGAFNRGFIRSIARFLGINEDDLVAEYAYGHEAPNGKRAVVSSEQIPRNYRPAVVALAIAVLVITGGLWTLTHYGSRILSGIHNRFAASANSPVTTRAAAPSVLTSTASSATNNASSANSSLANSSPIAQPSNPSATADPPASAIAASGFSLAITATKRAELMVISDGKIAFSGKLLPNNAKQFAARDSIEIVSRRPSALALTLNGHPISWTAIPKNSRKMKLTLSNLPAPAEPSH